MPMCIGNRSATGPGELLKVHTNAPGCQPLFVACYARLAESHVLVETELLRGKCGAREVLTTLYIGSCFFTTYEEVIRVMCERLFPSSLLGQLYVLHVCVLQLSSGESHSVQDFA